MEIRYSFRLVEGKPRKVIVDQNGKIVNKNPSKDELKGLEKEPRKPYDTMRGKRRKYTDRQLINELRRFEEENGRLPVTKDFDNDPEYPHYGTYQKRFGSWSNALKLAGLDVESMVKKGVLETSQQKARLAEIMVIDHFEKNPVDLAGDNCKSSCDGICPNDKIYDVKSSKIYDDTHWNFNAKNKYNEEIEIYYLLAFNEDYTKLEYAWRIPGEIAAKDYFIVGLNPNYEFTVEDMEEYDITEKIKRIRTVLIN